MLSRIVGTCLFILAAPQSLGKSHAKEPGTSSVKSSVSSGTAMGTQGTGGPLGSGTVTVLRDEGRPTSRGESKSDNGSQDSLPTSLADRLDGDEEERERERSRFQEESDQAAVQEALGGTSGLPSRVASRGDGERGAQRFGMAFSPWRFSSVALVIGGYSDNVLQRVDLATGIRRRIAAPFLGADVQARGSYEDRVTNHELRLFARGQHYLPKSTNREGVTDDGSVGAAYQLRREFSPNTFGTLSVGSSLATLNGARQVDASLMRFDAYASQKTTLQATMRGTIETTFDRTSKYVHNVDSAFSFVLRDQPLRNADGASSAFLPTGFESTMVSTDGTYIRDLEGPNSLFGRLRYQHVASRFTLDFVTYPPTNRGPQATNVGEAQVGLIHALSSAWVSTSALGIGGAYLVPGSEERGVALSPVASEVIGYSSTNAGAQIGGRYSLASINPRLGVGTNLEVFGSLVGVPFPKAAPTLAFVANANGLRSVLSNNDDADTRIWVGAAGFELRYGFAEYLAAVVGYNVRATMVTGPDSVPDFVRNTVFAGLAASWSSTRNAATPSGLITPMVGY